MEQAESFIYAEWACMSPFNQRCRLLERPNCETLTQRMLGGGACNTMITHLIIALVKAVQFQPVR